MSGSTPQNGWTLWIIPVVLVLTLAILFLVLSLSPAGTASEVVSAIFNLEAWKLIVDLVKGIAWPLAALIIAAIYRNDFRGLIPRVRKAGPGGVEFDPVDQPKNPPLSAEVTTPTTSDDAELSPRQKTVAEQIREELKSVPQQQHVKALIHSLAKLRLAAYFENTYSFIFGSQIRLLRVLHGAVSMALADADAFFQKEARSNYPSQYGNATFEDWLQFLIARDLVVKTNTDISITETGREFLTFLHQMRYSEAKAL
jgi:hypothetical protein